MTTVSTPKQAIRQSARVANEICTYRWFSPDVIAAMLVHRTKEKKVFWVFDSIIMQNGHKLLLFSAPTWPSYQVNEGHLLMRKV